MVNKISDFKKILELKRLVEQQEAMINFQSEQHNVMVNLGIKREKVISNLKYQISELKDELVIEQDLHASMIKLAENNG